LNYSDGEVAVKVHFKNRGGSMTDSDIVEMQVRPVGSGPLSFSSTTQVCDKSRPENVYKTYDLESGESDSTTISTSAVETGKEYTVYLLTREGCAPDNEKVDPYYNSVVAGTVDTTEESVDNTGNGLPLKWIVGVGVLLVAGGAYRKWG